MRHCWLNVNALNFCDTIKAQLSRHVAYIAQMHMATLSAFLTCRSQTTEQLFFLVEHNTLHLVAT